MVSHNPDIFNKPVKQAADLSHFYVVLVISNPIRFKRRYELFWKTYSMILAAGVNCIVVEHALGKRPFILTDPDNPFHVQVRGIDELWLKENLINIGITRICQIDPEAALRGEVMWQDADCFPMVPYREFCDEVWHALQRYEVVQCWDRMLSLGPNSEPVKGSKGAHIELSFMKTYADHGFQVPPYKFSKAEFENYGYGYGYSAFGHTGLCWAANISAIHAIGGILDVCVLGSGDWHMAHAFVGMVKQWSGEFSTLPEYKKYILEFEQKCERWLKRDVGCVKMMLGHWWHGKIKSRGYNTRGAIHTENDYNPFTDIKKDAQGLYQLETWDARQMRIRDLTRAYFESRNEDSVDL